MPMPGYPPAAVPTPAYRPPGGYPSPQPSYPRYPPQQPATGHPAQPPYSGYPQGFAPYQQNTPMYSQQTGKYSSNIYFMLHISCALIILVKLFDILKLFSELAYFEHGT